MAKKKKKSAGASLTRGRVVDPVAPVRGAVVAWHWIKEDGALGVNYTNSMVDKGFDVDKIDLDWFVVPGVKGVRTPVAWSLVGKDGLIVDFEYVAAPYVDTSSSSEDDEDMEEEADGGHVLSEEYDGQKEYETQFHVMNSGIKRQDGNVEHVGTSAPKIGVDHVNGKIASGGHQCVNQVNGENPGIQEANDSDGMKDGDPAKEAKTVNLPRVIAWTNRSKKVFMNAGLGGKLDFTPPTSNKVAIKVSEGLPKQSVWGWALLGQYVGFHPGHFLINKMMKSWGVNAKYRVEEGWFIFSFESEVDQEKTLMGGPYFINDRPMILKLIPDKFSFNRRDIATIPLWVRIYGLSRTFWTAGVLGRVASHIGKPLFMDPVTDSRKRGAYARVLVEVNFAKTVTREITLEFDDEEELGCKFLVENEPKYCKECCSFGHKDVECSFMKKKDDVDAKSKKTNSSEGKAAMGSSEARVNNKKNDGALKDNGKAPFGPPSSQEMTRGQHAIVSDRVEKEVSISGSSGGKNGMGVEIRCGDHVIEEEGAHGKEDTNSVTRLVGTEEKDSMGSHGEDEKANDDDEGIDEASSFCEDSSARTQKDLAKKGESRQTVSSLPAPNGI